jgi:hypothetical protein
MSEVQHIRKRSVFSVADMDCPAEEQMVRMALSDVAEVDALDFDLEARRVAVVHCSVGLPYYKA